MEILFYCYFGFLLTKPSYCTALLLFLPLFTWLGLDQFGSYLFKRATSLALSQLLGIGLNFGFDSTFLKCSTNVSINLIATRDIATKKPLTNFLYGWHNLLTVNEVDIYFLPCQLINEVATNELLTINCACMM